MSGTRLALGGDAPRVVDGRNLEFGAERIVAAIRNPTDERVACPTPGAAHAHLGWLHPATTLNRRAAFAAVARSRGETAPQVDALHAVASELRALDAESTNPVEARERAAAAGEERDRLRERVATLRGKVRARRDAGLDASDAADELASVAARLSEVTTEATAARQALDRAREQARDAYDRRERRLELQDRAANLQREARAALADRVRPDIEAALDRWRAESLADAADPLVAVAAGTVAAFDAPVVLELDEPPPEQAAREFDTPVVRL